MPNVKSKYPSGIYDEIVMQDDKILMEITIHKIITAKIQTEKCMELVWMIVSKAYGKMFKPVWKDLDPYDNTYNLWLELIFSWTEHDNKRMISHDSTLTDFYVWRKIYLNQDPENITF